MNAETIQIDEEGRVALPKPLRERFNLSPGDKLWFSADDTGIRLEPAPTGKFIRDGTVLVFTGDFGEPMSAETIAAMNNEDRAGAGLETPRKPRKK